MRQNPLKKYLAISIVFFFIFSGISIAKCTSTDNEVKSDFPATGFFYVTQKDGVWWFVTPKGEKFFEVGVNAVGPGTFYYGNISDWVNITKKKLEEWGFNAITRDRRGSPDFFPGMPYVTRFTTYTLVGEHGWVPNSRFPDVFDPGWQKAVRSRINDTVKIFKNDPNLLGYETDNEMKWGPDYLEPGLGDNLTLLEVYMSAPAGTPGKKELVRFLSEQYGNNTNQFNRVWNMNIQDFVGLFNYTRFGIEGWRVQSPLYYVKLKLFRDYPLLLKEPSLLKKAEKDVTDFSQLLAKTYFSFINTTLKTADPNHLNLGVRFHLLGVPMEVLVECGKYVDVISINYYRTNILIYDPLNYFLSKTYDCVTLDHWMRKYYEISGRPLMVHEFNSFGNDGSWPEIPGIDKHNARTQKQRAEFYNWYVLNCQKNPYMVGQGFYFNYAEGIGGNSGLVNPFDEPYTDFVNHIAEINLKAIENHENATYSKSYINKLSDISFLLDQSSLSLNIYKKILDSSFTIETMLFYSDEYSMYYPESNGSLSYNFNIANDIGDVKTHYVGGIGPNNYTKIQDAIDNASNGDKIFVYNGTYHEKLIINKSISLVGEDRTGTILIGFSEEDKERNNVVITIEADNVDITGFNITAERVFVDSTGNLRTCLGIPGIYLKKHNNSNISNNIFYKLYSYGVISLKSDYTKIADNIFYNTGGCGIMMDSSNNSLIDNNIFEENTLYGIWMSCCKNNKIQNNFVSKSIFGIIIWKAHYNIIFGNTMRENKEKGICMKECNHNTITSNNFMGNPTSANFFYSSGNVWDGNYWGRSRILPKLIFGKTGKDALIPVVNMDLHPLKEPYKP
jgi:parallel beta-helix repeat protein